MCSVVWVFLVSLLMLGFYVVLSLLGLRCLHLTPALYLQSLFIISESSNLCSLLLCVGLLCTLGLGGQLDLVRL